MKMWVSRKALCYLFGHEWFALNYWPSKRTECLRCGLITEAKA
jgi:hypothetical protein